jgi:GDP/UDP-N,N'-diacetylbacillosamine 2-epimerase (hydrolysing)
MNYIFTKANADSGGRTINRIIEEYSKLHRNIYLFSSLGIVKYLSALKYSTMIIGNSSSGIIEAPSFRIPTLNIGDRQKGRIQADSVINVRPEKDEILQGIYYAKSKEFQKVCERTINPYYGGETSAKIVDNIKKYSVNDSIELKKTFFDLEYNRNN